MRVETITESRDALLELDDASAIALDLAGRRLASSVDYYADSTDSARRETSVIRCSPAGDGQWRVHVSNMVGLISVGDLQILVEPKIPIPHFLDVLAAASGLPRMADTAARSKTGESLWETLAHWCVSGIEDVLHRDLIRDYRDVTDDLMLVRGRVDALVTARSYYAGRFRVRCEFSEFEADTPQNRVLRAAALSVAANPIFRPALRRRGLAAASRMDDVGDLEPGDFRRATVFDRRAAHYRAPLALAEHLLRDKARDLGHGVDQARMFLISTPSVVEDGIRAMLKDGLHPDHPVIKRGRQLRGSTSVMTPDLLFDSSGVVGDVKYKLATADWNQNDLYQAVAFATLFGYDKAIIILFAEPGHVHKRKTVGVGVVDVTRIAWNLGATPEAARMGLIRDVRDWLLLRRLSPPAPAADA